MNHHLTTLASLPAGAGFAASLPAEKNEQPEAALPDNFLVEQIAEALIRAMLAPVVADVVQMKAPYFEGPEELPGDMDEEGGE